MTESQAARSRIMRAVKGRDTGPELWVRRTLHAMGYRYRLHRADLPGKPDLVFGPRRKVIFVHGCFWHGHDCQRGARVPRTNREYWERKIERNRTRDGRNLATLDELGWSALVVWECELADAELVKTRLTTFLSGRPREARPESGE